MPSDFTVTCDDDIDIHGGRLTQEIRNIHAAKSIHVMETLPDCAEVLQVVLPKYPSDSTDAGLKRRQVQHFMKHWSAWDMALSQHPNTSHFVILDGSFELEVAQYWDAPLSAMLNEADTVAPGWEIMHLTEQDFVSRKAWECGVRFAQGVATGDEEDYRFMAYAVAVKDSTIRWIKDFRAWKAGDLSASGMLLAFCVVLPEGPMKMLRFRVLTLVYGGTRVGKAAPQRPLFGLLSQGLARLSNDRGPATP